YLLHRPQGIMLRPDIQAEFVSGGPMSTPSLRDMLAAWRKVTATTEDFLDRLTTQALLVDLPLDGKRTGQSQGSAIRRMTYHYWYHIGEIQAIRQMLGQQKLPIYVGAIESTAPYRAAATRVAARRTARTRRGGRGGAPPRCGAGTRQW